METVSWATWGCCLLRALLEGIGASPSSVFTGGITHTHTLMYTHIDTSTHTHTHEIWNS